MRERGLPTITQVSDTMLSIAKKGESYTYNYVFDAKYQIDFATQGNYYGNKYTTPGPMEDDINTMHRYRDSIVAEVDGPYERTAFGAYVLFPWNQEHEYENHHFYKSIEKVNIGGFPFLQNATSLVERFVENLIEKSPEEIQKDGILPRGSLEKWKETIEEKVLVGVISTQEEYRSTLNNRCFILPTSSLRKGWQEAKYVALYLSNRVGHLNGVVTYGEILKVKIEDEMAYFYIEIWKDLENVITPVNYGIATYIVTTLQSLKKAKKLPELFMKSEEEKLIWQMLRRVSDRIKVSLDNYTMDQAERISHFEIKGIQVKVDKETKCIMIQSTNSFKEIDSSEFLGNPSGVFKLILNELEKLA
jgi:hypothetical protein